MGKRPNLNINKHNSYLPKDHTDRTVPVDNDASFVIPDGQSGEWQPMTDLSNRQSGGLLKSQKLAAIEQGSNTRAHLRFTGYPGLTLHEQLLINTAFTKMVEYSAQTVIACELAYNESADIPVEIKEYFESADKKDASTILDCVNELHSIFNDSNRIIEFYDVRSVSPLDVHRAEKKIRRNEQREHFLRTKDKDSVQDIHNSIASMFGRSKSLGFNEREWLNIHSPIGEYDSDIDIDSSEELDPFEESQRRDANREAGRGYWYEEPRPQRAPPRASPTFFDVDSVFFSLNITQKVFAIYKALARLVQSEPCNAHILFHYVIDEYEGKSRVSNRAAYSANEIVNDGL
ncbi:MAG: hypothetical protein KAH18_03460 [Psychromonas sp.]|nr:hypothetical protein [Psychromonas sp.]